jgi:hypothetical protein
MSEIVIVPGLPIRTVLVQADVLDSGRLQPWLGPAIRGMLLRPLMERLCILEGQDKAERLQRIQNEIEPRYCRDCNQNPNCSYGRNWEPDRKLIDGFVRGGMRDGLRSLTIGALPIDSSRAANLKSTRIAIRLMAAGDAAIGLLEIVLDMLEQKGKSNGLGVESIRFQVDRSSVSVSEDLLMYDALPTQLLSQSPRILNFNLETPLFLKTADPNQIQSSSISVKRRFASQLTFRDLLSNSVRTVRRAINEFSDSEWGRAKNMSTFFDGVDSVTLSDSELASFTQSRISHRKDRAKWELDGFLGRTICTGVNAAYLPWLKWAGVLGIGDSRNCGAGVWKLTFVEKFDC